MQDATVHMVRYKFYIVLYCIVTGLDRSVGRALNCTWRITSRRSSTLDDYVTAFHFPGCLSMICSHAARILHLWHPHFTRRLLLLHSSFVPHYK